MQGCRTRTCALSAAHACCTAAAPVPPHAAQLPHMQEVGFLFPIFDMANHAATGEGANVAYKVRACAR